MSLDSYAQALTSESKLQSLTLIDASPSDHFEWYLIGRFLTSCPDLQNLQRLSIEVPRQDHDNLHAEGHTKLANIFRELLDTDTPKFPALSVVEIAICDHGAQGLVESLKAAYNVLEVKRLLRVLNTS